MQGCEVALKVVGTSLLEPSAYCQGVFTPGAVDIYENDLFPVPQCPINVEGQLLVTLLPVLRTCRPESVLREL